MCRPVFLKRRLNIPPFPKAATEVGVNMRCDIKHDVGLWTVTTDFVFKIRALHCGPLEFRTGFLAGAFNLKVATAPSLPLQQQADNEDSYRDRGDASISWISAAVQLLILMSVDEVMDWLPLSAVSPRLSVTQQCRSSTLPHISCRGWHTDASDLDSRWGGNKCILWGGKSADQNRPHSYYHWSGMVMPSLVDDHSNQNIFSLFLQWTFFI